MTLVLLRHLLSLAQTGSPAVRPLGKALHGTAAQALAQENDERRELSITQVFVVEINRNPWIALWRRRVTTRPR